MQASLSSLSSHRYAEQHLAHTLVRERTALMHSETRTICACRLQLVLQPRMMTAETGTEVHRGVVREGVTQS